MVLPAPGRFSITKGWPKIPWYFSASMRATMSVPPPAEAPTMMRTGFDGQGTSWAAAIVEIVTATAARRCCSVLFMGAMKIATFNVNGIVSRLPHLLEWLGKEAPDSLCLREPHAPSPRLPPARRPHSGFLAHLPRHVPV